MTPTWRTLLDDALNAHADLAHSRFVALATVDRHQRPANRMVTFRFFMDDDRLVFTADARSEKHEQLARQPFAELCWYFPLTRQQFRLAGTMRIERGDGGPEAREALRRSWRERSAASRQSFTWPTPGSARDPQAAFDAPEPEDPPSHFILLMLDPRTVDILDLGPQPHTRQIFHRDGAGWKATDVNP
ncbi:pyridoxamine 5'-phosphate oxidase family protein [Noviherbaspirillum galbum]|uniref:Pyridoxamine 5'-phosphate oxidase n=1 Tax=Noviherbaspirillum galbum TaxID=2709383 RepID=A0A6B3SQD1_9BURK|nr:pyridoxamine 5'-phosphate oxidase family protein [Noviherbaspirillum galbum]NEX63120.1 pyridoxamine 5'-phosphate oxidase [Noviherbaspirillum galbum]